MATKKKQAEAPEMAFRAAYIVRQSDTQCACGVARSEEDPEFAELPMPEPWGALRICRNCGGMYCAKKPPAEAPAEPAASAASEAAPAEGT